MRRSNHGPNFKCKTRETMRSNAGTDARDLLLSGCRRDSRCRALG